MKVLIRRAALAVACAFVGFACKGQQPKKPEPVKTPAVAKTPAPTPKPTPAPTPTLTPKATATPKPEVPKPVTTPEPQPGTQDENPVVVIKTNMGEIEVEIDVKRAPITANNFLGYVDDRFFDGTIFHRVISTFMIQGGGFTQDLRRKPPKAAIKLEVGVGLKNTTGTIAMARTDVPDSATSQFFINVKDNPDLDPNPRTEGYAVFGRVVKGMDVVDKIKAVPVRPNAQTRSEAMPIQPVVIESVRRK